jgi:hypothetical protein
MADVVVRSTTERDQAVITALMRVLASTPATSIGRGISARLIRDFAGEYRMARIATTILTLFSAHKVWIVPMRRDGGSYSAGST